ncbi:MAG TPA: G1 family glutamic endopeptidase, partial [Candidatus Acidoferrales bacterium]|nr:G1 family glutamic endopeptidase [Candidatus Acidoferrales bacterium]
MSIKATPGKDKLPFDLVPTSMKGVYSFVPPPKNVDLTTASRRTLIKHGVLMRRPDPEREPSLFALWRRFVGEIWKEENFVTPVFGTPGVITHNVKGLRQTDSGLVSANWSGCAVTGNWVGAMGVWEVPTVSKPTTPPGPDGQWQSSSWVGLDGGGGIIPGTSTTDVLQAGIAQNVDANGQPTYFPWYEWFVPNYEAVKAEFPYVLPIPIAFQVSPRDQISVVVQYVQQMGDNIGNPMPPAGPYHFGGVLLVNVSTGKAVNLYLPPPTGASFAGDSAEWIMECTDGPEGGTLPKFTVLTFQNAGACNVLDAPPASEKGVNLQNGVLIDFVDAYNNDETNEN